MTDTFPESLVEFSITEALGERCPDVDLNCPTCRAWAEFDRLKAFAQPTFVATIAEGQIAELSVIGKSEQVLTPTPDRRERVVQLLYRLLRDHPAIPLHYHIEQTSAEGASFSIDQLAHRAAALATKLLDG